MSSLVKVALKIIVGVYDKISAGLVFIGAALILFMMLSIGASVLFRRTFLDFGWALEVSEYILIIITLFGAGWLLNTGGHVRVDILSTQLYGRIKSLYNALIFGLVALICFCFMVIGLQTTYEAYLSGTLEVKVYLEFRKWILLGLFPLASFIMFIEAGKLAVKDFRKYLSQKRIRSGNE